MPEVNIGKRFVEKFGRRFRRRAEECRRAGVCCWKGCSRPYSVVYLGFPFCSHHEIWVEGQGEKIFQEALANA